GDADGAGRLASRIPQREVAEVGVDIARGAVSQAKLDLERTVIRAPFNATVASESVEVGEVVAPGSVVATLVGTDAFWVRVSVPVEDLALLDIPGYGAEQGSPARVIQRLGPQRTVERTGAVVRLVNELDAESRTAQVLVEIANPLDPPPGALPLLPGAFVDVQLTGSAPSDVVAVPRVTVFEGRHVWVVDDEQRMHRRTLQIAWGDDEQVYASGGLRDGDRVVVTPPTPAIDGMEVRTEAKTPPSEGTAPLAKGADPTAKDDDQAEG
nr:efflux RND transporter periplasmic adaptor subunit [Deltaproteobacteria bacterium]